MTSSPWDCFLCALTDPASLQAAAAGLPLISTHKSCIEDVIYRSADKELHLETSLKAFNVSSDCSALIPLANTAMRSDVQESQARGLLHLGRRKEALESAELLGMELETL
ncbi:uncharacterized protein C8orf76 homolog [Phyllobates terribilis]|uniref:uncharacterized protein C8orf76 homolog n=1 Tax=Phyllobates terribilis TaxID=111132 RepID=UPI003CCAF95A